jgi:hypothetical protein
VSYAINHGSNTGSKNSEHQNNQNLVPHLGTLYSERLTLHALEGVMLDSGNLKKPGHYTLKTLSFISDSVRCLMIPSALEGVMLS